jgi:hypothetical protein
MSASHPAQTLPVAERVVTGGAFWKAAGIAIGGSVFANGVCWG